ncbi:MAG: hypothetical protein P4L33_18090 [Capsulimonadaceae bacterium]|nr:hypothetical protein [Capsulimonadaceae bacterium]
MSIRLLALSAFVAVLAFVCMLGACSRTYAAPKPAKPVAPVAKEFSQDQVDGIVSALVDDLWAKADYYWHRGDYPRIIALDRIIVEADPQFMEPYSVGGWLMESDGDLKDAESFYKLGVARNQDSCYMYYNLAAFYFGTLKNYAAAVKVGEQEVRKSDADINDWRMLAHSYEKNHQLDQALATWRTIKTKWPNGTAVDVNLLRVERLVQAKSGAIQTDGGSASANAPAPKPSQPVPGDNPVLSL